MRIGCAVVSDCLSEFREFSLSIYSGLVQTYGLVYAYAYVLGRGRTPDGFFSEFAVRGQLWVPKKIICIIKTNINRIEVSHKHVV